MPGTGHAESWKDKHKGIGERKKHKYPNRATGRDCSSDGHHTAAIASFLWNVKSQFPKEVNTGRKPFRKGLCLIAKEREMLEYLEKVKVNCELLDIWNGIFKST